jgi:hypothetical protein
MSLGFAAGFNFGPPNQYPLVNGFRYGWSSIEMKMLIGTGLTTVVVACESIDYDSKRTREKQWGFAVDPISKTQGEIDYTAKIKIYKSELNQILNKLASADPTGNYSFGDQMFGISVSYTDTTNPLSSLPITDFISGCTIDTLTHAMAKGPAAIAVEIDLQPLLIEYGSFGATMSSQLLPVPQP